MRAPLAFNSNLHPAETVAEIIAGVIPLARQVREALGWVSLGIDLRLGSRAIAELADADRLRALRAAFDAAGIVVTTINAFPLSPFQEAAVKDQAYHPDWSSAQRLADTIACIDCALALNDQESCSISTCPGSFKPWGLPANDLEHFAAALVTWAQAAAARAIDCGRRVILAIEPEPWCSLENTAEVVAFWRGPLASAAATAGATAAVATHLGICFDTCHCSLAFEDQVAARERLVSAGIPVPKCQFSAALEVALPDAAGLDALRAMHEPRFLHQTAAISPAGSLVKASDLDGVDALLARLPTAERVRCHFHVPVFWPPQTSGLSTTIRDSEAGLRACLAAGCDHVAVETYTWSVLAADEQDVVDGCVRELRHLEALVSSFAASSA